MIFLMLALWAVIGAYWYITDAQRVRRQAEDALTRLIGGRVRVHSASLSIFEGLRLDQVTVLVDSAAEPDSLIFSARTLLVNVDLARLIRGSIEPTRIVAIDPHVRLTENTDTGQWNYQRLTPRSGTTRPATGPASPIRLPEILLRNARVEYAKVQRGSVTSRGSMSIEAQLTPQEQVKQQYRFRVQSRGQSEEMGPRISGVVSLNTGRVEAKLHNFAFGDDMRMMLPVEVQQWWTDHQLAGRIDLPQLVYTIGAKGNDFTARMDLRDVTLTVRPEESQSSDEAWRRAELAATFDMLRAAGVNDSQWIDRIAWLMEPQPVRLQDVSGTFTFRRDGIELGGVQGAIAGNRIRIDGCIEGYAPDAPLELKITSMPEVVLGAETRIVNTLPPAARETYDHLRPRGRASVQMTMRRAQRGARIDAQGEIRVNDGAFTFDKFPYPVSHASGRIVFGPDRETGQDKLELIALHGKGIEGGPNQESRVQLDGLIAPLTADAGVTIKITGQDISSEPALMRSFPPMTRKALSHLDAPGKGDWPKFMGDFVCDVDRPPGPHMPWTTSVDIALKSGEGALVAFPYHLSGITGTIKVREDHLEIIDATMERDGATLVLDGRVDWGKTDESNPGVRPEIHVVARDVPIDKNLLDALPETHRQWLTKLGVRGKFDLEGDVRTHPGNDPDLDFDFSVAVHEAGVTPDGGKFALSNVGGELRLKPEQMTIIAMHGRRGDAEVNLAGAISWPKNDPRLDLTVDATDLTLDKPLRDALPAAAQEGWDLVRPAGTVDARIRFTGGVADRSASNYDITILPRKLAVTPTVFPCKFSDLTGSLRITPEKVEFTELIARRGQSRVVLGGGGDLKSGLWNLTLSADRVDVDNELIAAMPASLGDLARDSEMRGSYDVSFSKLRVHRDPGASASKPSTNDKIEFAVHAETRDGSFNAGVPIKNLTGQAEFAGTSDAGKLGALTGRLDFASFQLGDTPVEQFSADITKLGNHPMIRLTDLRCDVAGGHAAGNIDWYWLDNSSPRYGVALVLRDADVRTLVESAPQQLEGRLTASLALEGGWDNTSTRRGRGDLLVEGKNMYRLPLLLGLLQITDLALPLNSPFTQATARYGIEGNRVTFESVDLTADQMQMRGSGYLDFSDKQVRMTFVTDSKNWPKLPIVGDFLQGARHELLQIHVRGSIEDPKVSAGSMQTIKTTIDEVFRGDEKKK